MKIKYIIIGFSILVYLFSYYKFYLEFKKEESKDKIWSIGYRLVGLLLAVASPLLWIIFFVASAAEAIHKFNTSGFWSKPAKW
jgi:hypothetical protein